MGIAVTALAAILGASLIGYLMGRATGEVSADDASPPDAVGPTASDSPTGNGTTTDPPEVPNAAPAPGKEPPVSLVYNGPKGSVDQSGTDSVALTFDDGPHAEWTPKVLDLLRENDIKATFCVVGTEVEANPQLVRDIVADGHMLCNHSWGHEFELGEESVDKIRDNLQRTNDAIRAAAPEADIGYYRQPGGKWTPELVAVALDMGMAPLHWSVDTNDWNKKTSVKEIGKAVTDNVAAGGIVLMHDGGGDRSRTYKALKKFLPGLNGRFTLSAMP